MKTCVGVGSKLHTHIL